MEAGINRLEMRKGMDLSSFPAGIYLLISKRNGIGKAEIL